MITLFEHQKKACQEMHNGCILCGGVGSGKSFTALAYYYTIECGGRMATRHGDSNSPMKRPKDLYIITTARKRDTLDWQGDVIYFGLSVHEELSPVKVVVDSWNNLEKYTEVRDGFFIFDEQRVVGYGSWTKNFLRITKGNHWILLSATPGDTWLDYMPVFIANGFYRNKTEFTQRHIVYSRYTKYPKIEYYINIEKLIECKKRVVVEMPYQRNTTSHTIKVACGFDKNAFLTAFRGRWNIFEDRPIQQASEWCYVLRRISNSDRSRLERLLDIFEERRKLIVFYNFDYELEILRDGISEYMFGKSDFELAEYNGHRHDDVPTTDNWIYLVQYNAGSEAWNCITTDTIVFYSLNYSYKMMEQASGRINRANTPFTDLYYYIFYANGGIDKGILTALKNKRDFNANRYYTKNQKYSEPTVERKDTITNEIL